MEKEFDSVEFFVKVKTEGNHCSENDYRIQRS